MLKLISMVNFKNYSFEYNAKSADVFKAIAVCSYAWEADNFKEGEPLDISVASFYGIIADARNTGERLNIEITVESYARELKNNSIQEEITYKQANAVDIIKNSLLPDGWEFQYPSEFDTTPRYISYILRNGTYISHISTILNLLGLDYTIYTTKSGSTYTKIVKAYFRDDFSDRSVKYVTQWQQFGNLSISVDYGKIATSVTVLGAESEQGTNQVVMDAEVGDWAEISHLYEIKDTTLNMPEFSPTGTYLFITPASEDDYLIELPASGDMFTINEETMVVAGVHFLPASYVDEYEHGHLTEAEMATYLENISSYVKTGKIVVEVDKSATVWIEPTGGNVTFSGVRGVGAYQVASPEHAHAIYDDIHMLQCKFYMSDYFVEGGNLPSTEGFFWIGSERIFYRFLESSGSVYIPKYMVRGVPTCASHDCEHCGSREGLIPLGWTRGCYFQGTDDGLETYCQVASDLKDALGLSIVTECPLCFDVESVCPITKCPLLKNDPQFKAVCPRGLSQKDVVWTTKYEHHKTSVVFPDLYYYDGVFEEYARDSLIAKYGYIPTQLQVKGVADLDGLDKVAEGILRLSALPVSGSFTLFNYNPWTVPTGYFPGDVIQITVATYGRYDSSDSCWYPTQWFDYADTEGPTWTSGEWIQCGETWYKIKQKFVIQKTVKNQRGMPEIYFGTPQTDIQSIMEYIKDTQDTTSQRHRNQTLSLVVASSETGIAAQVKNSKTGQLNWVRVVQ
jgi:hypothetical protein